MLTGTLPKLGHPETQQKALADSGPSPPRQLYAMICLALGWVMKGQYVTRSGED